MRRIVSQTKRQRLHHCVFKFLCIALQSSRNGVFESVSNVFWTEKSRRNTYCAESANCKPNSQWDEVCMRGNYCDMLNNFYPNSHTMCMQKDLHNSIPSSCSWPVATWKSFQHPPTNGECFHTTTASPQGVWYLIRIRTSLMLNEY